MAASFTEDNIVSGSAESEEQPDTRVSQVWVFYAKNNPLGGQTDQDNYRSVVPVTDEDAERDYGSAKIRKVYSRWIPVFGRSTAERTGAILLSRFRDPPRIFRFETYSQDDGEVVLGEGYRISLPLMQDETGARQDAPIQVTRLGVDADTTRVEAQELRITPSVGDDLTNRVIIIETGTLNFNLRTVHDTLFPVPEDPQGSPSITVRCIIQAGVLIGSSSTALPSFDVGDWPDGVSIILECHGRLQGKGGDGNGHDGGPALYTRHPIDLETPDGEIFGGGGGGAIGPTIPLPLFVTLVGGGGGGGRGHEDSKGGRGNPAGSGGNKDSPGSAPRSSDTPGNLGGDGGEAGVDGHNAYGADGDVNLGGRAGPAIDGMSFVAITDGPGDRRGPEVN